MTNLQPTYVTMNELVVIMSRVKGSVIATITAITEPAMKKTNNPFINRVQKRTVQNVMLNFTYENSVNSQREKEGNEEEFIAHPRKWGQRIQGTPIVDHKGKMYLETKPNGKAQSTEWFLDGQPTNLAIFQHFLTIPNSNKEHQGVEKEIKVRDFAFINIAEVKMQGKHYIVR